MKLTIVALVSIVMSLCMVTAHATVCAKLNQSPFFVTVYVTNNSGTLLSFDFNQPYAPKLRTPCSSYSNCLQYYTDASPKMSIDPKSSKFQVGVIQAVGFSNISATLPYSYIHSIEKKLQVNGCTFTVNLQCDADYGVDYKSTISGSAMGYPTGVSGALIKCVNLPTTIAQPTLNATGAYEGSITFEVSPGSE